MDPRSRIDLRAPWPLLSLPFLLLAAIFLAGSIWLTLIIFIGGLYVVAYLWVSVIDQGLIIERRLKRRLVAVGDRLEEGFELANRGWLPLLWVEIDDHSTVPGYIASVARSVDGQQRIRWTFAARCTQRGHFQVGPWNLIFGDPFGLFRVVRHYPAVDDVIIHPPIHTEVAVRLPAGRRTGAIRGRDKALQPTINAAGVREYRTNDPLRMIHWRTSARKGKLFVREFDQDAAGDVWLVLDFRAETQLGEGLDGTEEHGVLLAASLTSEAIFENRAAGLAVYSRRPVILPPATGEGQQWQILQALAMQRADGDLDLRAVLTDAARYVRRGTALILVTADLMSGWLPGLLELRRKGVEVTVVLLDRNSFGGRAHALPLQQEIRKLGFEAHVIQQGEIGRPLSIERPDEVTYKVTPMGKVIVIRGGRND